MLDTKTQQFKEWKAPTPGSWPYDVTADKNGEAWGVNHYRLKPA